MKSKYLAIFVGALFSILILTACGPQKAEINVEMNEFAFVPDTYSVTAGAEVAVNFTNTGALEHEMVIMILGTEATIPFDDDDEGNIYWENELEPGASETITFTAPLEPGEYQIVCGIAGHLEQGMKGTLIVTK